MRQVFALGRVGPRGPWDLSPDPDRMRPSHLVATILNTVLVSIIRTQTVSNRKSRLAGSRFIKQSHNLRLRADGRTRGSTGVVRKANAADADALIARPGRSRRGDPSATIAMVSVPTDPIDWRGAQTARLRPCSRSAGSPAGPVKPLSTYIALPLPHPTRCRFLVCPERR